MADVERGASGAAGMRVDSAASAGTAVGAGGDFLAEGLPVTFKNVTYTVVNSRNKKERLPLLTGVSGFIRPGEMSALMGPSGSGKTTLLDVLAGRKTVGAIEGDVRFAGERPSQMFLRRYTGYVEQFDTLLGILTVEEMLMYTAELSRPQAEPMAAKRAAVERLLSLLALGECRDVKIGSPLARGISGGQAKRVNIGVSLVTNPRVLFLDEPTSGLDSYTSNEVMTVVKQLASGGITVVATVHSPTPYIFGLFDRLLLLLRGRVVYFGPNGPPALEHFHSACADCGALRGAGTSDAEWLTDLTVQADRQGRAAEFAAAFEASPLAAAAAADGAALEREARLAKGAATKKYLATRRATETSFWWGLRTLLKYRAAKDYRSAEYLGPRVADKVIFTLLIWTVYWRIGTDDSSANSINIAAVLLQWCILPAYGAASYVPAIVLERPLFERERADGLYRVPTYLAAKILEELGIALAVSLVFAAVIFYGIALSGSFALFWMVYFCTLSTGIVLAYCVAALSPSIDVANAALPAYVTTLLFFIGFLIRYVDIPVYWKWYSYLCFLRYAWGSLMVNQFSGANDVEYIGSDTILEYYSLDGVSAWAWAGIEWAFFVVFTLGALAALRYVQHVRR